MLLVVIIGFVTSISVLVVTVVIVDKGDDVDNFNVVLTSPVSCLVTIVIAPSNIIIVGDVANVDIIAFMHGIILVW